MSRHPKFIEMLVDLEAKKNRAALARLRRGIALGPEVFLTMAPYVQRFVPAEADDWVERCFYLTAALFASHPAHWEPQQNVHPMAHNLGASYRQLVSAEERRLGRKPESLEQRFVALLDAHMQDLPVHLRHAISLLKSHEVRVDYEQLLDHLMRWDDPDRTVQRQWAKSFWAADEEPVAESAATLEN